MPLYEYRCLSCRETIEVIQKVADPPRTECPSCGGELEKLLSAPAIQFKGEGWYVTDYARKGKSDSKEDSSSGSQDKESKKSESKSSDSTSSDSSSAKSSASKTSSSKKESAAS